MEHASGDMIKRIRKSAIPFQQFQHWWKTDDPEWVTQRKEEWKILKVSAEQFSSWSAKEIKAFAQFYVYGEEPEYTPDGKSVLLDRLTRFLLTPFQTIEDVQLLFSEILKISTTDELEAVIAYVPSSLAGFYIQKPEFAQIKVQAFEKGVFGGEYKQFPVSVGGREKLVGLDADYFVSRYIKMTYKKIRKNEEIYNYQLDLVPLFISSIQYVKSPEDSFSRIADLVAAVLKYQGTGKLNTYPQMLADNLYAAFSSDSAPEIIKQHMK